MSDRRQSSPWLALLRREERFIDLVGVAARRWVALLSMLNIAIFTTVVLTILGLSSPVQGLSPVLIVVHQHPILFAGVSAILLTITIVAFVLTRGTTQVSSVPQPGPLPRDASSHEETSTTEGSWSAREQQLMARAAGATGLATVSTLAVFGLLFTILARAPWCPSSLCPAEPAGPHDATLEFRLTAVQSDYYVLTGNPESYGINNLPTSIAAAPTDQPPATHPYRVALSVHDLQNSGYPVIIEAVSVNVVGLPAMSSPLNIYATTALGNYQTNVYEARYDGAQPGSSLTTVYVTHQGGGVELAPGESDELDVQIVSPIVVDLRFQIAVTYRFANQTPTHSFVFPMTFEVVFAPSTSWRSYELLGGRLTPHS
jgi:hypothetical protein